MAVVELPRPEVPSDRQSLRNYLAYSVAMLERASANRGKAQAAAKLARAYHAIESPDDYRPSHLRDVQALINEALPELIELADLPMYVLEEAEQALVLLERLSEFEKGHPFLIP